jgi:hypothetical protein
MKNGFDIGVEERDLDVASGSRLELGRIVKNYGSR